MSHQPFYAQRQSSSLDAFSASSFDVSGSTITAAVSTQYQTTSGQLNISTLGAGDSISLTTNSGLVDVSAQTLLVQTVPIASNSAVSKAYVDAAIAGISVKQSCSCRATSELANLYTASGVQASHFLTSIVAGALPQIDGYSPVVGDRILVDLDPATPSANNGIYVVVSLGSGSVQWSLQRAADFNGVSSTGGSLAEIQAGSYSLVLNGTVSAGREYAIQTAGTIIVDTTPFLWVQINNAATHTSYNSGVVIFGNAIGVSARLQAFSASSLRLYGSTLSCESPASSQITLDCMSLAGSANYQSAYSPETFVQKSYVDTAISAAAPVGSVVAYGGITVPSQWVECSALVSLPRSSYPALFGALSVSVSTAQALVGNVVIGVSNADAICALPYVGAAVDTGAASCISSAYIVAVSAGANTITISAAPSATMSPVTMYIMPFGAQSTSSFSPPDLRGRAVRGWANSGSLDAGRAYGSAQAGSQVASSMGDANTSDAASPWIVEDDLVKNSDAAITYTNVSMYSPALSYLPDSANPKATLSRVYDRVRMDNMALMYIMKSS